MTRRPPPSRMRRETEAALMDTETQPPSCFQCVYANMCRVIFAVMSAGGPGDPIAFGCSLDAQDRFARVGYFGHETRWKIAQALAGDCDMYRDVDGTGEYQI